MNEQVLYIDFKTTKKIKKILNIWRTHVKWSSLDRICENSVEQWPTVPP